jgi:hypothetical protein
VRHKLLIRLAATLSFISWMEDELKCAQGMEGQLPRTGLMEPSMCHGREVNIGTGGGCVDYLGWLSLMSTLEESLVVNFGSIKVWVMDPSLFDV